jgi:hypothetical protein
MGFSQAFPGYLRGLPDIELRDMEIQESQPIDKWEGASERIRHTISFGRFLKKGSLNVDARRVRPVVGVIWRLPSWGRWWCA